MSTPTNEPWGIRDAAFGFLRTFKTQRARDDFYALARDRYANAVLFGPAAAPGVEAQGVPVAWRWKEFTGVGGSPLVRYHEDRPQHSDIEELTPLYAAPVAQRQPLSEEQLDAILSALMERKGSRLLSQTEVARAIEAAHDIGEKKHG